MLKIGDATQAVLLNAFLNLLELASLPQVQTQSDDAQFVYFASLLGGPVVHAKLLSREEDSQFPFWLYIVARAVHSMCHGQAVLFGKNADGVRMSVVERLLVGYAGLGAIDVSLGLLVRRHADENAKKKRKVDTINNNDEKKASVSCGRRSPLVRVAYTCFMQKYGAKLQDYARPRVGDLFELSETQFEGWTCEFRKKENDQADYESCDLHKSNPAWLELLTFRL